MKIKVKINSVSLTNFRCYSSYLRSFSSNLVLIYGPNAVGKSSLIESIYLLSLTKSPRTSNEKDMIKDQKNNFFINGSFVSSVNNKYVVSFGFDGDKKVIKKNGSIIKKTSDYIGSIDAVWFSSKDLNLINGTPKERRSNFDRIICQISKVYFTALSNYKKLLKERNALLKWLILENKTNNVVLLETIDQKVVSEGKKVIKTRKKIIEKMNEILQKTHSEISGTNELIEIKYVPNVDENSFEDELKKHLHDDVKHGNTSVGPHKDDYIFIINNKNIGAHGSQGQQRNVVLSLKLSEVQLIYEVKNEYPILLLDDVFSELDKNRQNKLLKNINSEVQTFITTTSISDIEKEIIEHAELIHMKGDK